MTPERKPTILFLYTELADYFVNCARQLAQKAKVVIVHWEINEEAPFDFDLEGLEVFKKKDIVDLKSWAEKQSPDTIVVSGWIDSDYIAAAKSFKKKIPVVLALDNQWKKSLRQQLGRAVFQVKYKKVFSHAWVPGSAQKEYAHKLGFSSVLNNFYVANAALFSENYEKLKETMTYDEKTILFVGRYVNHKGIFTLWNAFLELVEKYPDWKLKCIGTGEEWGNRVKHNAIDHLGFLQPKDLADEVAAASFVVVPSMFEPWGVVVQEMAISGMPLVVSDCVGAAEAFVSEKNGSIFAHDENASNNLCNTLENMMQQDSKTLKSMGKASNKIGKTITPEDWAEEILGLT